jgi:hypothetical protein
MSIAGKNRTTLGVDHTGAPRKGQYSAPGEAGLISHRHAVPKVNGVRDVTSVTATLGKAPLPKRAHLESPPIHNGMNAKSRRDGTHFSGLSGQDLSRYDANPGDDPLVGAPRGKDLKPVALTPGMKSQTSPALTNDVHFALGKAALAEAKMSPDDKMACGIGNFYFAEKKHDPSIV